MSSEVKVSCKSNLVCHQITHDGEKPFKCDPWDKTFVIKSKLTFHQKTYIRESRLNVRSVIKVLFKKLILLVIREHTMVKS